MLQYDVKISNYNKNYGDPNTIVVLDSTCMDYNDTSSEIIISVSV